MAVSTGNFSIAGAAVGGVPAKALALGATAVWQEAAPEPPVAGEPLKFTALASGSSVKLTHQGGGTPAPLSLEYSTDGETWSSYSPGVLVSMPAEGDSAYFRATASNVFSTHGDNDFYQFTVAGQVRVEGDATTLLEPEGNVLSAHDRVFIKLFRSTSALKDASGLKLPSLSVGDEAYYAMFWHSQISAAPELPATTLGANCYGSLFDTCYLVEAPDLSAEELVTYCYQGMFQSCTSLRTGPRILATKTKPGSEHHLDYMFYSAASLSSVELGLSSWPGHMQWMQNVQTNAGEFRCPTALGTNDTIVRGGSGCPSNWTVVNTDPAVDHRFRVRNFGGSDSTV